MIFKRFFRKTGFFLSRIEFTPWHVAEMLAHLPLFILIYLFLLKKKRGRVRGRVRGEWG
jgi:hypothetical protein